MARSRLGVRTGSEGFTLLEILVALAILAIAFGEIFGSLQSGAEQMRRAEAAMLRVLEARSLVDGAVASPALAAGTRTGKMLDGADWRLETRPLDGGEEGAAGSIRAYEIVLTVTQGDRAVLTLETVGIGG